MPNKLIWAGYQENINWDRPANLELRRDLGIAGNEYVVAYTGNVHAANRQEVTGLYHAIALINRKGIRVKLVRTGTDYFPFLNRSLKPIREKYCIELGRIPRRNLPSILSIADVLIQPGKPSQFNDYRFPSKLPEYLASSKPVILPNTNIGLHLKDHEECLLLKNGDALDISQKLESLLLDHELRNRIGLGGRKFAEKHLKWSDIAINLRSFYLSL